MTIEITEETKFDGLKNLDVSYAGKDNLTLYPNIPVRLQCKFYETGIVVPENANMYGKVYFMCAASNDVEAEIPVYFSSSE